MDPGALEDRRVALASSRKAITSWFVRFSISCTLSMSKAAFLRPTIASSLRDSSQAGHGFAGQELRSRAKSPACVARSKRAHGRQRNSVRSPRQRRPRTRQRPTYYSARLGPQEKCHRLLDLRVEAKCHWAIQSGLPSRAALEVRLSGEGISMDTSSFLDPSREVCRYMLSHAGACSREIKIERLLRGHNRHRRQHAHAQRSSGQVSRAKGFSSPQVVFGRIRGKLRSGGLVNGETVKITFVFARRFRPCPNLLGGAFLQSGIGTAQAATRTRFNRP